LIETLGDAYCSVLRRTAIGGLTLPGEGEGERIRPSGDLVAHLSAIELDADDVRLVRHGIPIAAPADAPGEEPVRLLGDGELVAIARAQDGLLRTEVVLPV